MNNKGFTLIELLAVIVILAIIALIATPIIINIINDARTQAKTRSAELVYTGVQYAYTSALYGGASGATIATEPSGTDLAAKFTVENADIDANSTSATGFTVTTSDGAHCTITVTPSAQTEPSGQIIVLSAVILYPPATTRVPSARSIVPSRQ